MTGIKCYCYASCTDYGSHGEVFTIEYCALHEAAPHLLELLEEWLETPFFSDEHDLSLIHI